MRALLPCPFCGGEAEIAGLKPHLFVRCHCCGCEGPVFQTMPDEAIAMWNRRTPEPGTRVLRDGQLDDVTREQAAKELRGSWHGVFLDGRNEHGSHVLSLPQCSIELEQDDAGNFLKEYAETILRDAEAAGFAIGDAVVATFELCTDEGFFSHYEYVGVSLALTSLLYGSPHEQAAIRAMGEKL